MKIYEFGEYKIFRSEPGEPHKFEIYKLGLFYRNLTGDAFMMALVSHLLKLKKCSCQKRYGDEGKD